LIYHECLHIQDLFQEEPIISLENYRLTFLILPPLETEQKQGERILASITEKHRFIPTSPFGIIIPVFRGIPESVENYSKILISNCATFRTRPEQNGKYFISVSTHLANLFLQRIQMFAESIIEIYENQKKVNLEIQNACLSTVAFLFFHLKAICLATDILQVGSMVPNSKNELESEELGNASEKAAKLLMQSSLVVINYKNFEVCIPLYFITLIYTLVYDCLQKLPDIWKFTVKEVIYN